jgi:hypothetical protein
MKRLVLMICWMLGASVGLVAQVVVYPAAGDFSSLSSTRIEASADREGPSVFTSERLYELKLRIGFPTEDEAGFLPDTGAPIIALWLQVQNTSRNALNLDVSKFTASAGGRTYRRLTPEVAFDRIIEETSVKRSILTRTIRGATLGRLAKKEDIDQARNKTVLLSLENSQIPSQGFREGLIFFEAPTNETFTVNVRLGDLWTRAFAFTNVKPKN